MVQSGSTGTLRHCVLEGRKGNNPMACGSDKTRPSKLGRKGDPRMHNAVAARISDPKISLLQALRAGGFGFPEEGGDDATLVDADNVTLGQRKNQLSRRLRLSRQHADIDNRYIEAHQDSSLREQINTDLGANMLSVRVPDGVLHPQTSPRLSVKRDSSELSTSDEDNEGIEEDLQEDVAAKLAKFHPQYHPIYPITRAAVVESVSVPGTSHLLKSGLIPSTVSVANHQLPSQNQNEPSALAVSSLSSTAAGIGMSLEQLAMSLSSTPNLLRVLSRPNEPAVRQELALNLFKTESRALLQKCMLLSGYEMADVAEGSAANIQLATKSWELEGARLGKVFGRVDGDMIRSGLQQSLPKIVAGGNESKPAHSECKTSIIDMDLPISPNPPANEYDHSGILHEQTHHHEHHHHDGDDQRQATCFRGQHVHKLSGKCGHKPVIHKPEGGTMHIDFLVDGFIECYEGRGDGQTLWPSRQKCADHSSHTGCATEIANASTGSKVSADIDNISSTTKNQVAALRCDDDCDYATPKEIPLSDINLDSDEWDLDYFKDSGYDDTLMGLIRLGGSTEL